MGTKLHPYPYKLCELVKKRKTSTKPGTYPSKQVLICKRATRANSWAAYAYSQPKLILGKVNGNGGGKSKSKTCIGITQFSNTSPYLCQQSRRLASRVKPWPGSMHLILDTSLWPSNSFPIIRTQRIESETCVYCLWAKPYLYKDFGVPPKRCLLQETWLFTRDATAEREREREREDVSIHKRHVCTEMVLWAY
jgi:hypothetical protein